MHDRVLTISGPVERVAEVNLPAPRFITQKLTRCLQAYGLVVSQLVAAGQSSPVAGSSNNSSIRLLISHNLMGTVIGRSGNKIKSIQDASGARMIASKDMLPQSTERVVEVQGSAEAISRAIEEIGRCLLEDWERGLGTVLFHPTPGDERLPSYKRSQQSTGGGRRPNGDSHRPREGRESPPATSPTSPQQQANLRTQTISIPSDMVGCIIGRNGTKITEIRRLSGSKISIAKEPHDETGERMFTIVGSPEANEKALFLLYNQLESEKERRLGRETQEEDSPPADA